MDLAFGLFLTDLVSLGGDISLSRLNWLTLKLRLLVL